MNKNSRIVVFGHTGLVGSSIVRTLKRSGYNNIITRTRYQLDLISQSDVESFFKDELPEYVFLSAAKVGGIMANDTYSGDFIYQNLMIQNNIIHFSKVYGVKKLLFLGSSCIYPRMCPQPMKEEYLLSGELEPTNESYAIAKIAGIMMCKSYNKQYGTNFISVMPTNLYGPGDSYDLNNSHVLPALIRKFYEAKSQNLPSVTCWGTGSSLREFLHVDDLSKACLFLMNNYDSSEIINVGTGKEISIRNLIMLVSKIVRYEGEILFDSTKPDGTPRKLLDVSKIENMGWKHTIELEDGIRSTYNTFLEELESQTIRII